MKLILSIILIFFITCIHGQDSNLPDDPMDDQRGPNEQCLRCICHARSGCYFLKNCANYSISRDYWARAGRPTVGSEDPDSSNAYTNCIKDDSCIQLAIRGYLASMPNRDCNCDGRIDCKDYAAIHLKGDQCRSDFNPTQLNRLDSCLQRRNVPNTAGWSMNCQLPEAQ